MTEIPEPIATPIQYEVSCLPASDYPDRSLFTLTVECRGNDRWAVKRGSRCYDIDGNPDFEPIPSERADEWLNRYRFDLDTALALAKKIAPTITYGPSANPMTVADMLARLAER